MSTFGWVAETRDPPWRWDLRRLGWTLCRTGRSPVADCRHVLLADARGLSRAQREGLARRWAQPSRLLLLGVEPAAERAELLRLGCGEVLGGGVALEELAVRARRAGEMVPSRRAIGTLTLDLFHRDARHGGRWLALHPREFGLLWRLAESPGRRVSRAQLLRDVWRLNHDPETNSVAVHVSRLRSKLAELGCAGLISTDPAGGYRLGAPAGPPLPADAALEDG